MPAPLRVESRRQIVERHQQGETLKSISAELKLPYVSVKAIWRHWRKHGKLTPNYEKAQQRGTRRYGPLYAEGVEMKRQHPRWGAGLIRVELQKQFPDLPMPSERTLQRWFRQAAIGRSPKMRQTRQPTVLRGQQPHQVWAVDAKEKLRLADGTGASWLVMTDEASGAVLEAEVFPPLPVDKG
jgi:transposase